MFILFPSPLLNPSKPNANSKTNQKPREPQNTNNNLGITGLCLSSLRTNAPTSVMQHCFPLILSHDCDTEGYETLTAPFNLLCPQMGLCASFTIIVCLCYCFWDINVRTRQLTFALLFNSGNINGTIFFFKFHLKHIIYYVGKPFRCADRCG